MPKTFGHGDIDVGDTRGQGLKEGSAAVHSFEAYEALLRLPFIVNPVPVKLSKAMVLGAVHS